jgi:hypothetical protein
MNNRRKGYSLENLTVNFMKGLCCNFKRVGMSGQLEGMKGDFTWVENGKTFRGESKSGGQVPVWLYKTLEKDKSDFLVVKRDRKEKLWVLTDEIMKVVFSK